MMKRKSFLKYFLCGIILAVLPLMILASRHSWSREILIQDHIIEHIYPLEDSLLIFATKKRNLSIFTYNLGDDSPKLLMKNLTVIRSVNYIDEGLLITELTESSYDSDSGSIYNLSSIYLYSKHSESIIKVATIPAQIIDALSTQNNGYIAHDGNDLYAISPDGSWKVVNEGTLYEKDDYVYKLDANNSRILLQTGLKVYVAEDTISNIVFEFEFEKYGNSATLIQNWILLVSNEPAGFKVKSYDPKNNCSNVIINDYTGFIHEPYISDDYSLLWASTNPKRSDDDVLFLINNQTQKYTTLRLPARTSCISYADGMIIAGTSNGQIYFIKND